MLCIYRMNARGKVVGYFCSCQFIFPRMHQEKLQNLTTKKLYELRFTIFLFF